LDIVALARDDFECCKLLKACQTDKLVLSSIELCECLQVTHILNMPDLVVAQVKDLELQKVVETFDFAQSV
jgi:hypothetical protein